MPPSRTSGAMPDIPASRPKSRVKPFGRSKPKSRARTAQEDTPEPDKESNKTNAFLKLPLELKLQIVEFIPTRDIPSIRMISESWAAAGAPSIFRDGLTIRPHLDDMDRLCQVVTNPEVAKGIRYIEFFAGDVDRLQLENAIERQKQRLLYATGGQMSKVWKQVNAIFDKARVQKHCKAEILDKCLPLLPNLASLKINSLNCPLRDIENPFCIAWAEMESDFDFEDDEASHFLDSPVSIQRYSAILASAIKCKSIQKLDLDCFPIDYFRTGFASDFPGRELLSALQPSPQLKERLSHITDLRIAVVGVGNSMLPYNSQMGRKMAQMLGCFQNITSLDLSYEEADDDTDECLLGFEDTFYRLTYPHLHSLRISGCDSTEEDLGKFLVAHKRTLRYLHIGEAGCTPQERTWKDVLTDLRDHMSLEKFELYVPEAEGRIYDVNWKPVVSDAGKGKIKDAKLLELYVLGKCPWPMAEASPRDEGWKRKFGAEDMMLLDLGEDELRDLLGEEWETDGSGDEDEGADEDEDMDSEESYDSDEEYFSVDEEVLGLDEGNMIIPDTPGIADGNGEWEDMEVDIEG
ncbi:hypothetical protein ONS95_000286 [Cadophora gregata]|uniref:uncharacterized protein n=1 Tax=Cadophora gregata TaxID=51156 RepID=UPI0026DCEBDF|nr:uncharacterized protein ONS95_000286 [Cadophora gregata]KAK0125712.1 hypothetical protein ONS96_009544 [Cadophora gregata f. sp. sojae]KAK0128311.1 hypothetical protein ONS95_000286 [Cadophora gregata]